jgi:hypothetical protein
MSIHARLLRFFPALDARKDVADGDGFDWRAKAKFSRIVAPPSRRSGRRRADEAIERLQ